jgi:hypothetical protein
MINSLGAVMVLLFGVGTVGYACTGVALFVLFGIELPEPFYWGWLQ